jgi:pyrroloquinoline quinone (PQQ) biosynthesis protein C
MDDLQQRQRERAYRIWEEEGRPEGRHLDHWRRAGEGYDATEEEAAETTEANEKANDEFNRDSGGPGSAADTRPPSVSSAD